MYSFARRMRKRCHSERKVVAGNHTWRNTYYILRFAELAASESVGNKGSQGSFAIIC